MKHRKTIMGTLVAVILAGTTASAQPAPRAEASPRAEPKIRKTVLFKDGQLLELDGRATLFEHFEGKGFLGVHVLEMTSDLRAHFGVGDDAGVLVSKVEADSPAARAGLKTGDVITAIDGKKIGSPMAVTRGVRTRKDGERISLDVSRNRAPLRLTATLEERESPLGKGFRIHLPEGKLLEGAGAKAAVDRLQTYFKSPEWQTRIDQIGDCGHVQTRIKDLEARLKELEKRLEKK